MIDSFVCLKNGSLSYKRFEFSLFLRQVKKFTLHNQKKNLCLQHKQNPKTQKHSKSDDSI
jgi:hypothetical protein